MMNGDVVEESTIVGGWKNFPLKRFVESITLAGRHITPFKDLGVTRNLIAGWAIHNRNIISIPGKQKVIREVMAVFPENTVSVFSYDAETDSWLDYADDLKSPVNPHLKDYCLEAHDIMLWKRKEKK
jgi:hypothetical protein